jgi:hypothetical protein
MLPRSYGYRAKKHCRVEVGELRVKLNACKSSEWQRAGMILQEIARLLGHSGGPKGARIEPRACRYCGYYGHSRLWCKKRMEDDEDALDRIKREDARYFAQFANPVEPTVYVATQTGQARSFDAMRQPYTVDSVLGPIVGAPGEVHAGAWTFDGSGRVVANSAAGTGAGAGAGATT